MTTDGGKHLGDQGAHGRPTVSFRDFVSWLAQTLDGDSADRLQVPTPLDLYSRLVSTSLTEEDLTRKLSEFCDLPYVAQLEEADLEFKLLSRPFCEAKLVVPVKSAGPRQAVVVSNPFDWETLEDLERSIPRGRHLALLLATPSTLAGVLGSADGSVEGEEFGENAVVAEGIPEFSGREDRPESDKAHPEGSRDHPEKTRAYDPEQDPGKNHPVAMLVVELLSRVMEERATHLVIEPSDSGAVAKASIAGRSHDLRDLTLETGKMLVARFKALAGMDLAKKRTPQTGRMEVILWGGTVKLRLSTVPEQPFERMTIRVLDPSSKAAALEELGLTTQQIATLRELASRDEGMILFVGPLGSGKTTTAYSLLAAVADEERTVVTVEDPIEHKIPFADQQEVGPGADRRALLQRAVHKSPDVLFLWEIKGLVSAQTCVDFTKAGHLTLTSMNSSNAATAVFRLDRLGVKRTSVADVLVGVVAQRLLKGLCLDCKEVRLITKEEAELLHPFTGDIPKTVAYPVGCSRCGGTGYRGNEGVFEVIPVGPRMSKLIREGRPISELRDFAKARGDLLVGNHGIRKIRNHLLPVKDVYRELLLEEGALVFGEAEGILGADLSALGLEPEKRAPKIDWDEDLGPTLLDQATILVAEDEEGTRFLLEQILSNAGYRVLAAADGGEALLMLGTGVVDLILSDIHMPNLDGLKLLEILKQHDIDTPVVLLTGEPSPDVEARGREMGVADYLRKPVQRDVLLERISAVLDGVQD